MGRIEQLDRRMVVAWNLDDAPREGCADYGGILPLFRLQTARKWLLAVQGTFADAPFTRESHLKRCCVGPFLARPGETVHLITTGEVDKDHDDAQRQAVWRKSCVSDCRPD